MALRLTPDLTSGYAEIDGQHRVLLERLDAAMEAAEADDVERARAALTALGDYLMAHFGNEEAFMAASLYPERGRHKAAHDLFMQDFQQLAGEMATAGLSVPVVQWITARIPEWVKFHIQVNDIPLGRYLETKHFRLAKDQAALEKSRAS